MRRSNTVVLTGMLVIAMVGAPIMAGSAAASQDTSAVITVTDGDGNTIDGANVDVFDADTGDSLGSAATGTNGEANVTWTASNSTTIDVEVYHPDYQPLIKTGVLTVSAGASEAYSASLSPPQTVTDTGTLDVVAVDADAGGSVSDVQFTVTNSSGGEVTQTLTADGQMQAKVSGGTYTVTADRPDHDATTREVTVTAGEVTTQTLEIQSMDTVTAPIDDGDAVDEVYAEFDLANYSDGENVTVYSDFTLVLEDSDGVVTEYIDLGTVEEDYEVGADDDLHTVYQEVDGTHDGAIEVVAATEPRFSDAEISNTGYFVADSGGAGGVGGYLTEIASDKVLIGAGISIIVIGGAVLIIGRDD